MDERIVIRHLNLAEAKKADEFPLKHFREITVGRDTTCEVKYDPDRDDLVSRKHARITVDQDQPLEFSIADLGSRNGTFVNRQRIFSPVKLAPGDVVQFGAGGPEFQFDVEPRPVNAMRPTEAPVARPVAVPATPEDPLGAVASAAEKIRATAAPRPAAGHKPIGKAAVERTIKQSRSMLVGGIILLVLLAAVAGYVFMR